MTIVYDDSDAPFTGTPTPYDRQDACRHWLRHYTNFRYLRFLEVRSDDPAERRQATHEILICERKMDHWRRHGNWDAEEVARGRQRIDDMWLEMRQASVHGRER